MWKSKLECLFTFLFYELQYITEKVSVLLGIWRALHVYPNGLHDFFVEFHIGDENQITELDTGCYDAHWSF